MAHNYLSRMRPIVGETPAGTGATYIVVEGYEDDLNIQVNAVGTVTFTVDWTNMNILYDAAARAAVNISPGGINDDRYIAPGDADWVQLIASGSADANAQTGFPVFALRINITGGTGSVAYHIAQA
jgi:hypothetical protein